MDNGPDEDIFRRRAQIKRRRMRQGDPHIDSPADVDEPEGEPCKVKKCDMRDLLNNPQFQQ